MSAKVLSRDKVPKMSRRLKGQLSKLKFRNKFLFFNPLNPNLMPSTQNVSFNITAKPGPMTLFVNNVGFTIVSSGTTWSASKKITFPDCNIPVEIEFNGVAGQA